MGCLPLHNPLDPNGMNPAVFDPLTPDWNLVEYYVETYYLPGPWIIHEWDRDWGETLSTTYWCGFHLLKLPARFLLGYSRPGWSALLLRPLCSSSPKLSPMPGGVSPGT